MRKYHVEPPNFRCKVIDHHDKEVTQILHAKSKDDLPAMLQGYKKIVSIKPFNLEKWEKRSQQETNNVITWRDENESKKTGEYDWRTTVWKYLKAYLFNVTNGKCAFCESDALAVGPGTVEHYRPKAAVEGDPAHKGYYWLAYTFKNYLPTCELCNSGAKMNKFPISGTRAYGPNDDLKAENPDLLNPSESDEDPNKHLEFVIGELTNPLATVGSTTHRGDKTIEILLLNRRELYERRRQEIARFLKDLDVELGLEGHLEQIGRPEDRLGNLINSLRTEGPEYYSAKMAALRAWYKRWNDRHEAKRKALDKLIDPQGT